MNILTRQYIELYNSGLSIYQIGKKLNKKPNSILCSLRYWKVPKVNEVFVKRHLKIPISLKTKYPIKLLGYLES